MLFFGTTIDGLQMGLCFAVIALGVYISYSILDFPDLSVDRDISARRRGLHHPHAEARTSSDSCDISDVFCRTARRHDHRTAPRQI